MKMLSKLSLIIIYLMLGACAEQPKKNIALVPVEERNVRVDVNKDTPDRTVNINNNKPVKQASGPVIVALIKEANNLSEKGNSAAAAAAIERGIRIEPKNPQLWHQLANIRIQQQQWKQAISMARKSNALAAGDTILQSKNWGVIAFAYEKLGNREKAKEARRKQKNQA